MLPAGALDRLEAAAPGGPERDGGGHGYLRSAMGTNTRFSGPV